MTASLPRPAPRLHGRALVMPAVLAAIWVFFTLMSRDFVSPRNLSMLMIELSVTATLALGMLLIILTGNIDLSAGSGVGLIGGIAAVLVFRADLPAPLALAAALLVALLLWTAMGAIIVLNRIQAFIITLGGLLAFKGLHWLVIRSQTVPVSRGGQDNLFSLLTTYYLPPATGWALAAAVIALLVARQLRGRAARRAAGFPIEDAELAFLKILVTAQAIALVVLVCNAYRGLPLSFLILCAVAVAVFVLTRHTPFGRYLYAIGGNEEAALLSGVPVKAVVIASYTIMGGIVAVTGFLQTAYSGATTTTVGELMELDAVAACVIGGASLRGGRGTVTGVLFGALVMASLLNGMTLLAVSPELKFIVRGTVLGLAVWADTRLART
ncbi:MAG: sugar ABC transporter permease [Limisphaerales bacterium]